MEKLREWLKAERGRVTTLAEILQVSPGAVSQWPEVPPARVLDVERATGISRHELRPDIFGPAPEQPTQDAAA